MAIVFKIRRTTDGLFSMGGMCPGFNKTGKIWKQKGHLTNHLGQVDNRRHHRPLHPNQGLSRVYDDCEIVPYELVETPAGPGVTISAYLAEIEQRKQDREEAFNKRHEKWKEEQRRKQYEELKKEFEPEPLTK